MKRDSMRRVLGALAEKPGLTNRELSGITGIKESAMSRYMIELAERGIVNRESVTTGMHTGSVPNTSLRWKRASVSRARLIVETIPLLISVWIQRLKNRRCPGRCFP